MNKGIWKFLTWFGLLLAVVAVGMIAVLRMQIFDFGHVFLQTQNFFSSQTQAITQMMTQQTEQSLDVVNVADVANLQRMQQNCFSGNDCIPSIDEPKFISPKLASKFLKDDDLVIGVAFPNAEKEDDPVKAYPIKIMNWHEVVNDYVNETPVVVTYSTLTMAPRVYVTLMGGKGSMFGVSGMMINSNLVLYDRETKSLWNQFDGKALTGSQRGKALKEYPQFTELTTWGEWLKKYPTTEVLSEDTGFDRQYDEYPFGDYPDNENIYSSLEHSDTRLNPKEEIFGIMIGNQQKAYGLTELQKALPNGGTLNDDFAGQKLTINYTKNSLSILNTQTKEQLLPHVSYYFAWEAFYPNTEVFKPST